MLKEPWPTIAEIRRRKDNCYGAAAELGLLESDGARRVLAIKAWSPRAGFSSAPLSCSPGQIEEHPWGLAPCSGASSPVGTSPRPQVAWHGPGKERGDARLLCRFLPQSGCSARGGFALHTKHSLAANVEGGVVLYPKGNRSCVTGLLFRAGERALCRSAGLLRGVVRRGDVSAPSPTVAWALPARKSIIKDPFTLPRRFLRRRARDTFLE